MYISAIETAKNIKLYVLQRELLTFYFKLRSKKPRGNNNKKIPLCPIK